MNCIIVDDEHLAIKRLESMLHDIDLNINIQATCENGVEGIEQINRLKPDVVFLDIQMPEVDGFEVAEKINYSPIIIFTTAFDEYALKAFQVKALRYLLKPIKHNELVESVLFIKDRLLVSTNDIQDKTITVKEMGKKLLIPIDRIELISTSNRIVFIHTTDHKKIIADKGMDEYEQMLPSSVFCRTHRSYLVNILHIESFENDIGGKRLIHMNTGLEATVSRERVKEFEKTLKKN